MLRICIYVKPVGSNLCHTVSSNPSGNVSSCLLLIKQWLNGNSCSWVDDIWLMYY